MPKKAARKRNAYRDRESECCVCFNAIIGKAGKLPCGHDKLCVDCIIKVFTQINVKCPLCRWTPTSQTTRTSQTTITEEDMYHHITGRIYDKSSNDEKVRAWVKQGLEFFNASLDSSTVDADVADMEEAAEMARQLVMETDDEEEGEEDEEDENEEEGEEDEAAARV